jgi:cell wall-associated NlpC family hydrolase
MRFGEQFAQQAIQWLDVPYQHRACTRGGCDCTGLLLGVARELGYLKQYELRNYPQDWNLHGMADNYIAEQLGRFGHVVPNSHAATGDVLIFHLGKCLAHCGILVNAETMLMVHCYRTSRKVARAIVRNSKWSKLWRKSYRIDETKLAQFG